MQHLHTHVAQMEQSSEHRQNVHVSTLDMHRQSHVSPLYQIHTQN